MWKSKTVNFLEGNLYTSLLCFFVPVFFGTLFQQLYNTVDAIVVGNFVGKQALAAVGGSTGTVINLLVSFVTGLSAGATVVVAQYCGKRDQEGVKKGVDAAIFFAFVFGIVLTVLGILFTPSILRMLDVPEDTFNDARVYMQIYFTGMLPTLIYNNGSSILRAVGDSKRPLYFLVASCLTNVVLDILFVTAFHMGVAGAAIATVLSQVLSGILTLVVLCEKDEICSFSFSSMHVDWDILKEIIKIGLPTGIQASLYSIANLVAQTVINGYGTDTVAAYTAFGKIDALFWNYSGAVGNSVMTASGQNFGAGNYKRVKEGIRKATVLYFACGILISFVCLTFGNSIYHLFTKDEAVIAIGVSMLNFLAPFWCTFVGVEILCSSIRACGDSLFPMGMTMLGIAGFRIVYILFFPQTTILDTLRCYPISWILTSSLFFLYYKWGGWEKRSLAQKEKLMRV